MRVRNRWWAVMMEVTLWIMAVAWPIVKWMILWSTLNPIVIKETTKLLDQGQLNKQTLWASSGITIIKDNLILVWICRARGSRIWTSRMNASLTWKSQLEMTTSRCFQNSKVNWQLTSFNASFATIYQICLMIVSSVVPLFASSASMPWEVGTAHAARKHSQLDSNQICVFKRLFESSKSNAHWIVEQGSRKEIWRCTSIIVPKSFLSALSAVNRWRKICLNIILLGSIQTLWCRNLQNQPIKQKNQKWSQLLHQIDFQSTARSKMNEKLIDLVDIPIQSL